jgi:hypothetical protein
MAFSRWVAVWDGVENAPISQVTWGSGSWVRISDWSVVDWVWFSKVIYRDIRSGRVLHKWFSGWIVKVWITVWYQRLKYVRHGITFYEQVQKKRVHQTEQDPLWIRVIHYVVIEWLMQFWWWIWMTFISGDDVWSWLMAVWTDWQKP